MVSEISANHSGNFLKLKLLIDKLSKAGVDAIKIQAYEAKTITIESSGKISKFQIKMHGPNIKHCMNYIKRQKHPFHGIKKFSITVKKKK